MPHDASAQSVAYLGAQGFTDPVLAVEAINRGRGETSIVSVDLVFDDGGSVGDGILDPPLPFRLIGESAQTWYFDAHLASAYAKAIESVMPTGKARAVRGRVALGSGKVMKSKNSIAIPSS